MESNSNKSKIAVLIPYFGPLPKWFEYFALSCSHNRDIDWHIFSDKPKPEYYHKNIIFHSLNLNDFNQLATLKCGFPVKIKHPYKLCDFKPLYGLIFSDYIEKYPFWGYGDLDVVYGNIGKFITPEMLDNSEIISMHSEFVPGHFCILKNTDKMKNLFREIVSYQKILQSQRYHGFDEKIDNFKVVTTPPFFKLSKKGKIAFLIFRKRVYRAYKIYFSCLKPNRKKLQNRNCINCSDFSSLVFSMASQSQLQLAICPAYLCDFHFKKNRNDNWKISWMDGKLIDCETNRELVYFHFQISKESKQFSIPEFSKNNGFVLSRKGFKQVEQDY